jgi:tetratricopeptide (TPR) repeat protein
VTASRRTPHPTPEVLRRIALGQRASAAQRVHVEGCAACRSDAALVAALAQLSNAASVPPSCPEALDLVLFGEGRLARTASERLGAHVRHCPACAADVEGLARSRAAAPGRVAQIVSAAIAAIRSLATWEPPVHVALATRGAAAAMPKDLAKGLAAYRAGRFAVARKQLAAVAAAADAPAEAHVYLAACLIRAGEMDAAIDAMSRAVRRAPSVVEYHWRLAQALLLGGRGPDARAALRAIASTPGHRRAAARAQLARLERLLEA